MIKEVDILKKRIVSSLLLCLFLLSSLPLQTYALSEPTITATGAIVMDFDTGEVYYEKNADVAGPIASMTKIMSLYLVFASIHSGALSFDTNVPISAAAATMSSTPTYSGMENLPSGGYCRADMLISLTIASSACGSVLALVEYISGTEEAFVAEMNALAALWGIDAQFADCTGWEDEGNAVTPRAMAIIAKHMLYDYPDILDYSTKISFTYQNKTFTTTNSLMKTAALEGIDGLKTGYTYGAGYCFTGTAEQDGRRIITVVMNSTDATTRSAESQALLEYGFYALREFHITGSLGFTYTELTYGDSVTIPVTVTRQEGVETQVYAGWYLDGQLIPGFSNDNFLLNPSGSSAYTFQATCDLEPGLHTLSFRIDPDSTTTDLALISYSCYIHVS